METEKQSKPIDHSYRVVYERLREIPAYVRSIVFPFDGWIVGGGARYLCGIEDSLKDWDVIIPVQHWQSVARTIPHGSKTNTFGGIKVDLGNTQVDFWADDLGSYLTTVSLDFDLIAVHPRTKQVAIANKR